MLMKNLSVMSPTFENNKLIPAKYTCDGDDVNPPLTIEGVPEGTKTIALIVDDPDAPMGTWDHWIVWNIPATTSKIAENTVPGNEGMNDFRKRSYGGPCPPSGTHRYFFKVYALDVKLDLSPTSRKRDVEKAMQGHVLAKGELVGLYRRSR
jgi:Raf kinase inhibitor-like YbhB/YbcL family protein